MQLYALDESNALIFANGAHKGKNYTCLECHGPVRIRGGLHRQNHFYHLQQERACRQNGKGMEHIQMQMFLHHFLPGECILEQRFPQIQRIADVVWHTEKIIFEIQCSPISAEEVAQRIQDYESLGFRVVWLLHDKQFNARRITAAEHYLTTKPHYYTNMNKAGAGIVYDQFDLVSKGIRLFKSAAFPIDLRSPIRQIATLPSKLPERLHKRLSHAGLFFSGDLHEHLHSNELFEKILPQGPTSHFWPLFTDFFTRPYRIFFRYLLEKASI